MNWNVKNKIFGFGDDTKMYVNPVFYNYNNTSVQAGAVLMPLAMFLLSLKSVIYNGKLAYQSHWEEKTYLHASIVVIMWLTTGPQEKRKLILPGSVVQCI